ncbi:MAG: NAD-dependent dehydratase [Desulfuromonas sp.]|nr:MAG: NAD-dependent dehydratase [Desulfuromonas sp.]
MRVFVTGGTGFVGHELLRQLTGSGHGARVLVRADSGDKVLQHPLVESVCGDVTEPNSLEGLLKDCEAVIHLVGVIREFPRRDITFQKLHVEATRRILAAAEAQGVERYLHMSANGTREGAATSYHRTKWQAEEAVRNSSLNWTIFRPSLIYGRNDQFINMLAEQIRKLPVVPVIGDGQYRMSPVAVEDVAKGFVSALEDTQTEGGTFHCGGPQAVSYNDLLDQVADAMGKTPPAKLHHPVWLMTPFIRALEGLSAFPITRDQLTMLLEGNVCDPRHWCEACGIVPKPLVQGLKEMFSGKVT